MTIRHTEIGAVSASAELVDFYRAAFALDVLEPRTLPMGIVHRIGADEHAIFKIFVPTEVPAEALPIPVDFWSTAGQRYATVWVDDFDELMLRAEGAGGLIQTGPIELRPGVRTMVLRDPEGNILEVMEDKS